MTRPIQGLLLLAAVAAAGELSTLEREVIRVAKGVRPSVVTVYTAEKKDFDLTGVVLTADGVILTLRSPLLDAGGKVPAKIDVRFPGKGKTFDAEPIDDDPASNTVLLRVSGLSTRPASARLAADARIGMWVLLVGNTFGAGRESSPTVSLGVISGLVRDGRRIAGLHASTLVNPGSVGAPVLAMDGRLLGVTGHTWTGAGGQSVVIPYEFIRRRYLSKGGPGARVLRTEPRPSRSSRRLTEALAVVMEDAVRRAQVALVGVRAAEPPPEPEPEKEKKEEEQKPADPVKEEGKKKPKPKPQIPQPLPVPGQLEAVDRCSGVVISADGLILCPLRITGWPKRERPLTVDFYRGKSLPARVLGKDERLRVALLKVEATGLEVLPEAGPDSRQVGSFALALGFPHEDPRRATPQVTLGIVSRTGALGSLHPAFDAVQTDAAVAGGNRGGPLVDIEGRLLGILIDVNDTEGRGYHLRARGAYAGNAGLGFALPMHAVSRILEPLKGGAVLRAAFLGVSAQPVEQGLSIVSVVEKNSKGEQSTAARAGLKAGDILVALAGVELKGGNALREALAHRLPGEKIEIVYLRDGRRHTAIVELGER